MRNLFLILCLAAAALGSGCHSLRKQKSNLHSESQSIAVRPETLDNNSMWNYFVGADGDPIYTGYIKFSLILDESGQAKTLIWHPYQYRFHAEYLNTQPEFAGMTSQQIDAISLYNSGRKVLLGSLLFPKWQGQGKAFASLDIQLLSQDPLPADRVAAYMNVLTSQLPRTPDSEFFYSPAPEQFAYVNQEMDQFQQQGIKIANRTSNFTRICYNSAWGVGRVKVIPEGQLTTALNSGSITSSDILVIDEIPREMPVVAGIVVSKPSSPSSHPALLAGMLGIPFVYEKDAVTLESWNALAASNAPVFFKAENLSSDCNFVLRSGDSLTAADMERLADLKKPKALDLGSFDGSLMSAVDLNQVGRTDAQKVGAKAANVAELRRIIPDNTVAEGLALPLGIFTWALRESQTAAGLNLGTELDSRIKALLQPGLSSRDTITVLAEIQSLIEKAKLSAHVQEAILSAVESKFGKGTRIKLRSSSNIEDHPEFNGAGLYESKGSCVGDDSSTETVSLCGGGKKDPVLKAVRTVWASLYSFKAWSARRYFGVDETKAAMGILIQRSFKGELANGVVISGYHYSSASLQFDYAVEMTGFPGEDNSVTNPPAGKIPETTLIDSMNSKLQVASTEVPRGRTLLTPAQYRELYDLVTAVHDHYVKALTPKDIYQFKLDMEWKLMEEAGQQKIIIKQVRPVPMKSSMTQGLDRGFFWVGEHKARLCPRAIESEDAFAKLKLSFPFEINLNLMEVPLNDMATIPSPIAALTSTGHVVESSAQAAVAYEPWAFSKWTNEESRSYRVTVPVTVDGQALTLAFEGKQRRSSAQPRLLLVNAESAWEKAQITLTDGTSARPQPYDLAVGASECDSDKRQGYQSGSYKEARYLVDGPLPLKSRREEVTPYPTPSSAPFSASLDILTSSGSSRIEKTWFIQIQHASIKGLLGRSIELDGPGKALHATGKHNMQMQYLFDLTGDPSLTATDLQSLKNQDLRYLLLTYDVDISATLQAAGNCGFHLKAFGVSDAGQRKDLGTVKLEIGDENLCGNPGGGIGIGIGPW